MRHVHLPLEDLAKQEGGIDRLADEFLKKQALRPEPAWYANLLEEHQAEIAAAALFWFSEVQNVLSMVDWVEWTDPNLWIDLEERLAVLLAPRLRQAARASARRQAIEEGEPIPLRQADTEIARWAGSEAARQARLIADETRIAVIESMISLEDADAAETETFRTLLDAGFFALNRRFARAALAPIIANGGSGVRDAAERARRLLEVRRRMIDETNTVSGVIQGILVAALLWEMDGKLVTKTYFTQADERVCPVCGPLHGQEIPFRGLFLTSDGAAVNGPPIHPFCRCFLRVTVRPIDAIELVL